jgi:hypothetical protein
MVPNRLRDDIFAGSLLSGIELSACMFESLDDTRLPP